MGTPRGMHERLTDPSGDPLSHIGETATLRMEMDNESSVSTSERDPPNDLEVAVKARVLETLFGGPARPAMLGRYVVLGTLGQGGMGTVLEAFDRTLDRRVAIKVLHEDLDDQHAARLLREARAMAKLSHPNVVPVFEADTVGGQTFVVMERVHGQTLRDWIRQHPRPDWRQCVEVFIDAGQGLAAAHAQGLVHRDFKPSNAILDDQGRARVLDFGLARRTEVELTDDVGLGRERGKTEHDRSLGAPGSEPAGSGTMQAQDRDPPSLDPWSVQALTETGVVLGTPAYMPPEQVEGREADARSDQFSFCVSLYEAVYGERPFEGGTMTGLMASMTNDIMRPAPKGSPVPTRLRTILRRGLAASPVERWPSMEALLHQLRALVAPRTRRWVALGLTAGLAGLGGMLALGRYAEVKDRCTGARAQLEGIWDDDRRPQIRAAILETERSFAPGTWERIEPRLDAYADAWVGTHTEACEATSVRGEQSDEALDLRMRCLDRHRTSLRATVDVLADADADVVEKAVELVAGLPPLIRCDDISWLERHNQRIPPPEDPDLAAAVQAQRARLVNIEAMDKAGRYTEALGAVQEVIQQVETLGYPPLQAEALYRRGVLRESKGRYAEAEQDLRRAHALAMGHHHDVIALDAAQALTGLVGYHLARHVEGRQWGEANALPLAQRSGDPLQEAHSRNNLGLVFESQGDLDNARLHQQKALAIRQEVLDPDDPRVATGHNNLGLVLFGQGELDDATFHHQRALAIWDKALGPDHPNVAMSLSNLGNVFFRQEDLDNALLHHQRALAIFDKALGPDHAHVAKCLNNVATVLTHQGELDDARLHFERVLTIFEKTLGPEHPFVADCLNNLGSVLSKQGDLDNALLHHQRALALKRKTLGPDHPNVATSLNNLGRVFDRQGDDETARRYYEQALAIQQEALEPDHPDLIQSLENLGHVLRSQGELDSARVHYQRALSIGNKALGPDNPVVAASLVGLAMAALDTRSTASARAHAERAVSIREAAPVAPALLAEARFVLARTLWSEHSERARARALAEQARDTLVATKGPSNSTANLADVDAWLATHRVK